MSNLKCRTDSTRNKVTPINAHQARFLVHYEGKTSRLLAARDASVSGCTIWLSRPIETGSTVTLSCCAQDTLITVKAHVERCEAEVNPCSPIPKLLHKTRVYFDVNQPRGYENSVLFFMALREYLEDFELVVEQNAALLMESA